MNDMCEQCGKTCAKLLDLWGYEPVRFHWGMIFCTPIIYNGNCRFDMINLDNLELLVIGFTTYLDCVSTCWLIATSSCFATFLPLGAPWSSFYWLFLFWLFLLAYKPTEKHCQSPLAPTFDHQLLFWDDPRWCLHGEMVWFFLYPAVITGWMAWEPYYFGWDSFPKQAGWRLLWPCVLVNDLHVSSFFKIWGLELHVSWGRWHHWHHWHHC